MNIKTTVSQVAMVGGDQSDRPSGILVDERARRSAKARRRGNLYALIEISGLVAGREIIARQLLEAVRDTYYGYQGSITAGLQEAIREVNDSLFNENRNALPGEQRTAGISCAVLRDDDLFIAQAGPAVVYLAHERQVTRFPDVSPWLDDLPLEDAGAAPLGGRRDLSVALFHTQVVERDAFLFMESTLARRLSPETVRSILARTTPDAALSALIAAAGGSDVSALAVTVEEEGETGVPAQAPALSVQTGRGQPASAVQEAEGAWAARLPVREWLRKAGPALAATLAGLGAALWTLIRRMLPGQISSQPVRATPTAPSGRKATPAPGQPQRAGTVRPRWESARKPLLWLALAVPAIVAILVLATYAGRNAEQREALEALWANANESWRQANVAVDQAAIRTHLKAAEGYLDQLIGQRPERTDAVDLRKQVEARLDEVNRVQRIKWIAKLKTYPAGAKLSRVLAEGEHIFVLDRNAAKVYHHKLDSFQQSLVAGTENTVLISRGQQVGGVLVGDLVDMAWVPVGSGRQQANLVILDSDNQLLQYDPTTGQLTPLKLELPDTWRVPKLVGSYFGRFYVLDPTANKIWRYQPTPDGYSAAPDDWLKTEADLMGVVDMSIGDSIYLLNADGNVRRFTTGEPDRFEVTDWDAPPSNPVALFARPEDEAKSVYVADKGNKRIVQCGLDGRFERQFRLEDTSPPGGSDALSGVTSLFVNEISLYAFFTSGLDLYMVKLPEPQ